MTKRSMVRMFQCACIVYMGAVVEAGAAVTQVVAVALANKMARMAWALLAHGGTYRAPALAAAA